MKEGSDRRDSLGAGFTCADLERLAVFYACDELGAAERAALEEHAKQCPACATSLARELRLRQAVVEAEQSAQFLDSSGSLLAQCRSELEEALDDRAPRARPNWLHGFGLANRLVQTFVGHPASSAALLLLMGIAVGWFVPQWYRAQIEQPTVTPTLTVSASPRLSDQELQTMGIAGINWVPDAGSGSPSVEVYLTAEKPVVVRGSLEDTDVKRVLTYVVQNGQRFDPGVRLDSVDVLRTSSNDREVRTALCAAARKDRNPGVRLRALEGLRGFEQDDTVRQTLLEALLNDANPGVRVEAINSLQEVLRAMAERGVALADPRLVSVLRDRMQKDPNNYVRMQSAAAFRQLGPPQIY